MTENRGMLLILATAIISGVAIFVNKKFGVNGIDPYIFTSLKSVIVALMITASLVMARDKNLLKQPSSKQWIQLVLGVGLIGGAIPFLLFFKGLSLTSAAHAAFIHKIAMAIFIFILAVPFLKEKISQRLWIGIIILTFSNIFLLILSNPKINLSGFFFILAATVFWAGENVLSKHLLKSLPSRVIIWARMTFGSIFIVFFLLATGQVHLVASLNLPQIGWTFVSAMILCAYVTTWYTGLKYVKISVAATILMIGSAITSILVILSSGQEITVVQSVATLINILIIGFVAFALLKAIAGLSSKQAVTS